jgi:hypothetical protein
MHLNIIDRELKAERGEFGKVGQPAKGSCGESYYKEMARGNSQRELKVSLARKGNFGSREVALKGRSEPITRALDFCPRV